MRSQPRGSRNWVVLFLSNGGDIVADYQSEGETAEQAFENLTPFVREAHVQCGHRVEPYPKRLETQESFSMRFDVPGMEGEKTLPVEVNEYYDGIGFRYSLTEENASHLRRVAPATTIKRLASIARHIIADLEISPKRAVIQIQEPPGLGHGGYLGRGITARDKSALVQLELPGVLSKEHLHLWEGILYHEFMHVKYVLDRRWPSLWPFYLAPEQPLSYRLLDRIQHFSIDGWLESHGKPLILPLMSDVPGAGLKAKRLTEFRWGARGVKLKADKQTLAGIANRLWGQDTHIWEVAEIISELGLTLDGTPLGRWLKKNDTKTS